jgi:YD repeat-containing protein
MYLLPADRDEKYGLDTPDSHFAGSLADIVALPANAGDVLMWTQHVLHWGSRAKDSHRLRPRMSIGLEFQRRDVPALSRPLLDGRVPCFEARLALIAKQILHYRHMYGTQERLTYVAEGLLQRVRLPDSAA